MGFTIINAEQRSEEWFAARVGRLTGSVAGDMLAKIKSGEAAGRRNLRIRLALERLTGRVHESGFLSPAMQTGIDREDAAIEAYVALTGNPVVRTGFLRHDEYMAGCSLDGHVGAFERLVSVKCRQPAAHLEFLRTQKIPSDAMAQIRHELWMVPSAEFHDYFSWNPDFPEGLQAVCVTVERAEAQIEEYHEEAMEFLAEVEREVEEIGSLKVDW